MPGVFISYRREDSSGYAGRLFDILSGHFGRQDTFMDLDGIQGGDDFTVVIEEKIKASDVLVAVVGNQWLTAANKTGSRRLDDPNDFVRLEIGRALQRGIRVIPVLVGGATLPRAEDLPADLRTLCQRQAVEIRDAHFHADADQLIQVLHKALHGSAFSAPELTPKTLLILASTLGIAVVVLAFLLLHHPRASKPKAAPPPAEIAGKWKATVKYDWGDTYKETFDFEVDRSDLTGTASFLGADRGILEGRIDENHIIRFITKTFATISSDDKTHEETHHYKGTVENGAIQFTLMTDSNIESHVPVHFTASRSEEK